MSALDLVHNAEANRYEGWLDDTLVGFADYRLTDSAVDLTHTEVDPAHGGNGYGADIVRFALDDIQSAGRVVVPTCPFVARYIERHPEYQPLLARP